MALQTVELNLLSEPVPEEVTALLREADLRAEAFRNARLDQPVTGFVSSDGALVYEAMRAIVENRLATGAKFCEWGSGLGVATCLAAFCGFDACGIEIVPELVEEAQDLADEAELTVELVCGSYVPEEGDHLLDFLEEFAWVQLGGHCGYDLLDLDPDDFDVVFSYPWPGEEPFVDALFDRFAADGALLLTYLGVEDIRLMRKVP